MASAMNQESYINQSLLVKFNSKELKINNFIFKILLTPGHTPGSVCYQYNSYVFDGDLVFYDAIGRSDLHHSNPRHLFLSIQNFLRTYSNDFYIFPGHGKYAQLIEIKQNNPFFKNL